MWSSGFVLSRELLPYSILGQMGGLPTVSLAVGDDYRRYNFYRTIHKCLILWRKYLILEADCSWSRRSWNAQTGSAGCGDAWTAPTPDAPISVISPDTQVLVVWVPAAWPEDVGRAVNDATTVFVEVGDSGDPGTNVGSSSAGANRRWSRILREVTTRRRASLSEAVNRRQHSSGGWYVPPTASLARITV